MTFFRSGAAALALTLPLAAAGFRASAVKVDITPSDSQWLMGYNARQSTGVLDKLYTRVVGMDAGGSEFYLISSDLCLFTPAFYHDVMRELQKQTGITQKQVWWSVTHTHAAPEVGPPSIYKTLLGRSDHEWNRQYAAMIQSSLIDAVKSARAKLEPAKIGIGTGFAQANINRRAQRRGWKDLARPESGWSHRPPDRADSPGTARRLADRDRA